MNTTAGFDRTASSSAGEETTRGEAPASYGTDFVSVHAGENHTCGIKSDQSVECWGEAGAKITPPQTRTIGIAAGGSHGCKLRFDGQAECWGSDSAGQSTPPTANLVMIDAGRRHTCGIDVGERARCWGDNAFGQSTPPLMLIQTYTRIALGENASCGIRDVPPNKPITCWGDPQFGQTLPPAGNYIELDLGARHGCAIEEAGVLKCWGDPFSPGAVSPPNGIYTEVATGLDHSCAISTLGTVKCWGDNSFGQSESQSKIFTRISAGSRHTCGILLSGRIACWGTPSDGRIDPPPGLFESISAYEDHTCAVRVGGGVACWGLDGVSAEAVPIGDSDGDGLDDGADNCPFIANVNQADGDNDGVGDVCDVCPTFPDPEQLESYLDGVGDRCDVSPRIEITPDTLSAVPLEASYDVHLDCGSATIERMTPDVVIPFFDLNTSSPAADFGDGTGCTPSCAGASGLGPTVLAGDSGATGPGNGCNGSRRRPRTGDHGKPESLYPRPTRIHWPSSHPRRDKL